MSHSHRVLNYTCNDGAQNCINLFSPVAKSNKSDRDALIVFIPAMGIRASKYDLLCSSIASAGLDCACLELRGIGQSSVRASRRQNFYYQTLIEQEIKAAIDLLVTEFPKRQIYLIGHSLGGQMSALFAASSLKNNEHDAKIAGLGLIASCSIYVHSWPFPTNIGLLFFTQFANLLSKIMGYFPGKSVGFGGLEARGLISDWAYNARTGKYHIYNTETKKRDDYDQHLAKLELPILTINFSDDNFAPMSATRHLLQKMRPKPLHKVMLSSADINGRNADHFQWMKEANAIADKIVSWVTITKA